MFDTPEAKLLVKLAISVIRHCYDPSPEGVLLAAFVAAVEHRDEIARCGVHRRLVR